MTDERRWSGPGRPGRSRGLGRSGESGGSGESDGSPMKTCLCALFMLVATTAVAQTRADATLRVTVADPSGAVIVGAHVRVTPGDAALDTGPRGEASFTALEPGRYSIHVESAGFEARDVR